VIIGDGGDEGCNDDDDDGGDVSFLHL